jgi:hypothetical protein
MGIGLKRGFAYAKLKQEKNKVTTSLPLSIIINIFIKAYKQTLEQLFANKKCFLSKVDL